MPTTLSLSATPSTELVSVTLATLSQGGLIVFPTETVYGFFVDATNPQAVQKLLQLKKRRPGKAISVAVADQKMAERFVILNEQAQKIYHSLLPGPITVVSQIKAEQKNTLQPLLSEFDTLGVRLPDYPLLQEIISKFGQPLTATSANKSGGKTPYSIADILSQFSPTQISNIDLIIDGGTLPTRPPSVVIDTTLTTPIYFRGNLPSPTSSPQPASASPLTTTNTTLNQTSNQETFFTNSPAETQLLAQKLLFRHFDQLKERGLVMALDGDLGTGKTTFTQGLARYLNLSDQLDSPTYTYLKEYSFQKNDLSGKLFHLDVWKINSPAELQALQLDQLYQPSNLIIIEWFSQIQPFLAQLPPQFTPPHLLWLTFSDSNLKNPDQREIVVQNI